MTHSQDVLNFWLEQSGPAALVVVSDVNGGTLRPKGSLMAVTPTKTFGYISSGCVDSDITIQARQSLEEGENRRVVYGKDSPFQDIRLPCGGTLKADIIPKPDREKILQAAKRLKERQDTQIDMGGQIYGYIPPLRLRIIGRGEPFIALARLAQASGFDILGQSPDAGLCTAATFTRFDHLTDPANPPLITDDPWTAIVMLFHDHDWEPAFLRQALAGEAFYIGAMGSSRTHRQRLETLKTFGVPGIGRIFGPIGLIPAMRDANHLAVSILAEIISVAHTRDPL